MRPAQSVNLAILLIALTLMSTGCNGRTDASVPPPSPTAPLPGFRPTLPPNQASILSARTPDGAWWTSYDVFDGGGGVTGGTPPQGLRRQNGQLVHVPLDVYVRAMEVGPDGALYVSADCGLLRIRDLNIEKLAEPSCDADSFTLPFFALDVDFDAHDGVWIGGMHGMAHLAQGVWHEYPISARRILALPDDSVWAAGWDGGASADCCLTHIVGAEWITYTYHAPLPVPADLDARIRALLR